MGITVGVVKPENSGGGDSTASRLIEVISVENQQEYEFEEGTIIQAVFFNKALCLPDEYTIVDHVLNFITPNPMTAGDSIAIIRALPTE